jgi:thiopurine S-methyltransferase
MDYEDWHRRWREGRIGFHEGKPNAFLARHHDALAAGATRSVFVPLCGKSEDLAFLAARGHRVVGVELSAVAADAFFEEHGLSPARTTRGPFEVRAAGGVEILVGDYFALESEHVGPIDCAYDRAALIAMHPDDQQRYADRLLAIAPRILLVTFAYDPSKLGGPPFSVPAVRVAELFAARAEIELLEERIVDDARFADAGPVVEAVWKIERR